MVNLWIVVLSVMLVHCGHTIGWIKMSLGTEVGLSPGHIVLDGEPAPPTKRGTAAPSPIFRPMSTAANQTPISVTAKPSFYLALPLFT